MEPREIADEPEPEPEPQQAREGAPEATSTPVENTNPLERSLPGGRFLFSTEGGQPVASIEEEYQTDRPTSLIIRGAMKMASTEGFPAVADVIAGTALKIGKQNDVTDETDAPDDNGLGSLAAGDDVE